MIYLSPEIASGLGEDTFWTWFNREVPNTTFNDIGLAGEGDVILRYSTKGTIPSNIKAKSIALCWELLPEMKVKLNSNYWDSKIELTYQVAKSCDRRVVASKLSVPYYEHCGNVDIIPIGVDTNLFKPSTDKNFLRNKYNLPLDKKIIFWGGTNHPMKGFQNLLKFKESNSEYHYVCVWKTPGEATILDGFSNYILVNQEVLSELMGASDYLLCCGLLQPFFMIEWEAMACGLKPIILNNIEKDFIPSQDPRNDIFAQGWSRDQVKFTWEKYLNSILN